MTQSLSLLLWKKNYVDVSDGVEIDVTLYRQEIGILMYLLVGTKPDISFSISLLAQNVEKPTKNLWAAVNQVLRYISGLTHSEFCIAAK